MSDANTLQNILDRCANEGDRVYFGSTNDFDDFREIVQRLYQRETRIIDRPTIAELEAIINGPNDRDVAINPDGTVTVSEPKV
jgi:hypothetical protein